MALIYHITTRREWEQAQAAGEYRAESLATQGFIHNSTSEQVTRVANAIYRGQQGLVLLCIDRDKLNAELRFEPPDTKVPAHHYTGELFPHLYGALNTDAVVNVLDFPPNEDGTFALPSGVDA
ncbi:MAG: DUF952 domain-containing protein [Anaerolineae bacterium]